MRETRNTVHNYSSAASFLKGSEERKIAHNVQVVRLSQVSIAIRLHNTHVITFNSDNTATLSTGGWDTAITVRTINAYSGSAWRVFREGKKLFVEVMGGETRRLVDGMSVRCLD